MLQEDCLESLHTYVNYGLMAMDTEESDDMAYPFQRLYFLIRDWRMPTQHPFGAEGGQQYLKKKLEITSKMSPNGKEVRETLGKCFEQMDCFLMPGIGEKAQQEGFKGCLSQLSDKFLKKLDELVEDLLNPDDITVKSVFGSEVTATDVVHCFEEYVKVFNCEDIPAPVTLIEATAKIAFQKIVSECVRKYFDGMNRGFRGKQVLSEFSLNKTSQNAKKNSMAYFKKARKLGKSEMAIEFEEELNQLLKSEFDKIYSDNEKKRQQFIDEAKSESLQSFRQLIEEEFPNEFTFLKPNKLKDLISSATSNALCKFKDKIEEQVDEEFIEQELTCLEIKLQEEESRVEIDNQNRLMKAEQQMDQLVATLTKEYLTEINETLLENPFLPEDELKITMTNQKNASIEAFEKKKISGGKFVAKYAIKLEESLSKTEEEILKSFKLNLQEAENAANSVLDETLVQFEEDLSSDWNNMWEPKQIESKSEKLIQDSISAIEEKINIPQEAELAQNILLNATQKLNASSEKIQKDFSQFKRDCEQSYSKAVEASLECYVNTMDEYFKEKKFHTRESLEKKHEETKLQALLAFESASKIGNHPQPEMFITQLETRIIEFCKKNVEINQTKREACLAAAKNIVNELVQKYQSDMMKDLDFMNNMEDLDEHHQMGLEKAQQEFNKTYANEDFAEPFLIDLEEEIDKAYGDLKDYFELQLKDRSFGTKNALAEARKVYMEEIEKHCKNTVFMRPVDLHSLHERLSFEAIKKCEYKTPLTAIQRDNFKSALELTYQQYKEQNDMNVPVDPAIGIDLGTTYSCVAVYQNGAVKIIPNAQGSNITPSYVCYHDAGFVKMVGQPAKSKAYDNNENTIYDAKRIIGRDFNDSKLQRDMKFWAFKVVEDQKIPKIQINSGKLFYPEQVSSEILKDMKKTAEAFLNRKVMKAVITVPAYFTDGQRQATIDAGKIAGLKVLTILNEPTSAAIAYKLQHSGDHFRHVLVYDLGGGTFDVAVLKISKGNIEALAVDGDTHLGGQDFDQRVMEHCCLEFKRKERVDLMEGKDSSNATERNNARRRLQRLQQACEAAKKELSSCRTTNIDVAAIYNEKGQSLDLMVQLSRNKFEELNNGLFTQTLEFVDKVLLSAKITKSKIDDVVLVGGSTRIPKVQELLEKHFDGKALNKTVNPDEAVAFGAAVHAAVLNGKIAQESIDFNVVADVTPMSLGVEIIGGRFSCIIPKNTKIPAKITEKYYTTTHNQTSVCFRIFQGEKTEAEQNTFLGEFVLRGVPPAPAGKETLEATMEIDRQGVLKVTAATKSTGGTNSIKITEDKHRMSQATIEKILAENKRWLRL